VDERASRCGRVAIFSGDGVNGPSPIPSDRGNRSRERIPPQNPIPSVVKALDVLEAFDYEREELEVSGLAQKLGLHKNNVFRLLATLETRGYIEQDGRRGNYRLGLKTFEVGNVFLHHLGIRRQARPVLEDLVTRCNETAYLAVLDGPDVIYVRMHETTHSLRVASRLGRRLPAYCTAAGTCQLAYESQDRLNEIFRNYPLKRLTEHTITRFEDLLAHLKEISRKGYAVDDEEWEYGVRCVAAPVRDYTHRVVGAVGLTGPAPRLPPERIEAELVPLVKETAARLSQRLGYEASARVAA
jgi:DNA-binding IclR family transcriptional regulator